MACRNCYKYPFCEKCNSPTGNCNEEKSKRIEREKVWTVMMTKLEQQKDTKCE